MNWIKLTESVSNLLTQHSKSIIQIVSLLLVGFILKGFEDVFHLPEVFVWLYFSVVFVSFLVIITILYVTNRSAM